jgi:hypothetical protein
MAAELTATAVVSFLPQRAQREGEEGVKGEGSGDGVVALRASWTDLWGHG